MALEYSENNGSFFLNSIICHSGKLRTTRTADVERQAENLNIQFRGIVPKFVSVDLRYHKRLCLPGNLEHQKLRVRSIDPIPARNKNTWSDD